MKNKQCCSCLMWIFFIYAIIWKRDPFLIDIKGGTNMDTKTIHLSDCVFGYIFDNGFYDKPYIFLNSVHNIANFIHQHKNKRIRISDANNHDLINYDHGILDQDHSNAKLYEDVSKISDIQYIEFIEGKHERYQNEISSQLALDI